MGMTLAQAVLALRREVDDWIDTSSLQADPPSHVSRLEPAIPVAGSINGIGTKFRVRHYPVLSVGIQIEDQLGTPFVFAPATSDLAKGLIDLTAAPVNPPSTEIRITYFSMFAQDGMLKVFLQRGVKFVDVSSTPTADTDPIGTPEGLETAVIEFAKSLYYEMLSTKTADFFDFGAGGKTEGKSAVPQNWTELAKLAYAKAVQERDDFYKRKGRRNAPALGVSTPQDQRAWTPNR